MIRLCLDMRPVGLVFLAALGLAPAQAIAASQVDEDACRPDVFRLCMSEIPDENAIVTCLNHNLQTLSPACHAVIDPSWRPTLHPPKRRLSAQ